MVEVLLLDLGRGRHETEGGALSPAAHHRATGGLQVTASSKVSWAPLDPEVLREPAWVALNAAGTEVTRQVRRPEQGAVARARLSRRSQAVRPRRFRSHSH